MLSGLKNIAVPSTDVKTWNDMLDAVNEEIRRLDRNNRLLAIGGVLAALGIATLVIRR